MMVTWHHLYSRLRALFGNKYFYQAAPGNLFWFLHRTTATLNVDFSRKMLLFRYLRIVALERLDDVNRRERVTLGQNVLM